jgi:hypothetical protein
VKKIMGNQTVEVSISLSEQQSRDLLRFHETTEDDQGYDVPAERMKSLAALGLIRSKGFRRYEFTDVGDSVVERLNAKPDSETLDERMKAAGMFTVSQMMGAAPMDVFIKHAGVNDLDSFLKWVEMKRAEYVRMQARYDLGEKPKDDDMYEWVIAHNAVFAAVHVNLKAAMAVPTGVTDKKWHCKTCWAQWEGLLADHTCQDGREDVRSGWRQ